VLGTAKEEKFVWAPSEYLGLLFDNTLMEDGTEICVVRNFFDGIKVIGERDFRNQFMKVF
jgi:hypothetical protein